jgi:hypothetical protein
MEKDIQIHNAAVALGRKGGSSTSPRKQAASRRNAAKATAARKAAAGKVPTGPVLFQCPQMQGEKQ